jgi:HK97 family phage portal protein
MGRLRDAWNALTGGPSGQLSAYGSLENPAFPITPTGLSQASGVGGNSAGVSVNEWKALGYTPLYQAVSMISGDAVKIPIKAYQKSKDGKRQRVQHQGQQRLDLYRMANEEISGLKFLRRLFASALLHNNGYAYIDWAKDGSILGLYNLLPDRTYPIRIGGQLKFVTQAGSQAVTLDAYEVLHIEGVSIDGLEGANLIRLFREDFAVALARRGFTAKFFESGMTAGGILGAPPAATPEAIRKVEATVKERFSGGSNAFKTVVLRDGFKWYSTQVNPEQAQLSQMDADQARAVARMFNLDPSKLGVPGSTSYNHTEMAQKNYYDSCLSPWLLGLASEVNIKLLSASEQQAGIYFEHEINALLWADSIARNEIATKGIQSGRFSPNETRAWDNLDGYAGGDEFYMQSNVTSVEAIQNQASAPSVRQHLEKIVRDSLTRATNRCEIKAKKGRSAIQEDAATLREMLVSPLALAIGDEGRASEIADAWIRDIESTSPDGWQGITQKTLEAVL